MTGRTRAASPSAGREIAFLVVVTVGCLVPFLAKPLHVDDALFYWEARQIAAHPLDPFGFAVHWYTVREPMALVTRNPPGACYFLALAGILLGWSAPAMHAAFLLPAVGAVVGTRSLARRLGAPAMLAALLVLTAPGFLVSATAVMSDVPLVALWLLATVLWLDGVEGDDGRRLVAAGLVAAAAVLTKYSGAAILPLFAVYALLRRGVRAGAWRWIGALLLAVVPLVAYQLWSSATYGQGHLSDALDYARQEHGAASVHAAWIALAYVGGAFLAAGPLLLVASDLPTRAAIAGAGLVAGASVFVGGASWWRAGAVAHDWWTIALHFGVFAACGTAVVLLGVRDLWRRRDPGSVLLVLWLLGMIGFAGFLNWTANVRSVLPAVPAAAILLARAMQERGASGRAVVAGVVAASLGVAWWVALGDAGIAAAQVRAGEIVRARTAGHTGTLWFQGHWGFQVVMEAIGARPTDAVDSRFFPGDLIVVPRNNTNILPLPPTVPVRREHFEVPIALGGTTICNVCGAGFYSSDWGPLPYRLDRPPPEGYDLLEIAPAGAP